MTKLAPAFLVGLTALAACAEEPPSQLIVAEQALVDDLGPVQMLIDLGPNDANGYYPSSLTPVGSYLYFAADVGGMEAEGVPCRSDGVETTVLRDADVMGGFEPWGDDVYFFAREPQYGADELLALFRTDGTAAGTEMLVEFGVGTNWLAGHLTVFNDQLFFWADTPDGQRRLWVSDGTPQGTRPLAESGTQIGDMYPYDLFVADERLFIVGYHQDVGIELFVSDGTSSGTSLVADIYPGTEYGLSRLAHERDFEEAENGLFFRAYDAEHGGELWFTDGTEQGTYLVADIDEGEGDGDPKNLTWVDGQLFFAANDNGDHGAELWTSDGTTEGTAIVRDIYPGSDSGWPNYFAVHNGHLYFSATSGYDVIDIWTSDGTEAGTKIAIDVDWGDDVGYFRGVFSADDYLVFDIRNYPDTERYATDMSSGSNPIELIYTKLEREYTDMSAPTAFDGSIWFYTSRLWRSDGRAAGTSEGTQPLNVSNDFVDDGIPDDFTVFDNKLWFVAEHESYGLEIWHTDGTTANTAVLGNLTGGFGPKDLTAGDNELFFSQYDGSGYQQATIWRSDGTVAGSHQVSEVVPDASYSYPNFFTPVGNLLYFSYQVYAHGTHLWVTDGTAANTRQVVDLATDASDQVAVLGNLGNLVLFLANDGGGRGLWVTDGTVANTEELIPRVQYITTFVEVDGLLFFGVEYQHGMELWRSDGTPGGTYEIEEIYAGNGDGVYLFRQIVGRSATATTHFFAGDDGVHGPELWVTDGTAEGTEMVADINPGAEGSIPNYWAELNGLVYFVADDGVHGGELWRTDGTEAGTEMVADVFPGPAHGCKGWSSSWVNRIFPVPDAGLILFPARNEESNVDLWISDGTEAGTVFYMDVAPGIQGSYPHRFNRIGDKVVFLANDASRGVELWTLSVDSLSDPWPPVLNCPTNVVEEATSSSGARASFSVTATDDTTANPQVTLSHASGSTFPLSRTSVTATASDAAGNSARCTFSVEIVDTTAPDLSCPSSVTEEATKPEGANVTLSISASDAVTSSPGIVATPASGSTFALGVTGVTVTASDDADNESTCDFDVLVQDTTPPSLICSPNLVFEAGEGATEWPVDFTAATVSDEVTADPAVTSSRAPGSSFPIGTTPIIVTAEDDAGNEDSCSFDITVNEYGTVVDPPGDHGEDAGGYDAGYDGGYDSGGFDSGRDASGRDDASSDGSGSSSSVGCGCNATNTGNTGSLLGILLGLSLLALLRRA